MDGSPETVRQVLRSWLANEVLTPQVTRNGWSGLAADKQGQQRNREAALGDDPGLWAEPNDNDPPPWPLRARRGLHPAPGYQLPLDDLTFVVTHFLPISTATASGAS